MPVTITVRPGDVRAFIRIFEAQLPYLINVLLARNLPDADLTPIWTRIEALRKLADPGISTSQVTNRRRRK